MGIIVSNSRIISNSGGIKTNSSYSISYPLVAPQMIIGSPSPGKKVKMALSGYNSNIYYTLHLPLNYKSGNTYSVIFETPGNIYAPYSGMPNDIVMGYGLSLGFDFIWVCAPYVNSAKTANVNTWWGNGNATDDPTATVETWTDIITYLKTNYNINKIILAGFSRGAIGCCYVGCWNDVIAANWDAYFAASHYDGGTFTASGSSTRIARVDSKKTYLFCGSDDSGKANTVNGKSILDGLGFPNDYSEKPSWGHSPDWILLNDSYSQAARTWINQFK